MSLPSNTHQTRHKSHSSATWTEGYRTNDHKGISKPGTAWCGLNSKQLKIYDKTYENNKQRDPTKKAYYDKIIQGRQVLRFELSIRSRVYFRDEEIKNLILTGKFDEAGKKLMLKFMNRHQYTIPNSKKKKFCPKYKRLLKLIEEL